MALLNWLLLSMASPIHSPMLRLLPLSSELSTKSQPATTISIKWQMALFWIHYATIHVQHVQLVSLQTVLHVISLALSSIDKGRPVFKSAPQDCFITLSQLNARLAILYVSLVLTHQPSVQNVDLEVFFTYTITSVQQAVQAATLLTLRTTFAQSVQTIARLAKIQPVHAHLVTKPQVLHTSFSPNALATALQASQSRMALAVTHVIPLATLAPWLEKTVQAAFPTWDLIR